MDLICLHSILNLKDILNMPTCFISFVMHSLSHNPWMQERRYLLKEFPELVACGEYPKLLEVGCGNGSSVLPILR